MAHTLFHKDNDLFFDITLLRQLARHEVEDSSLIQRAKRGERIAAEALTNGFWPFTYHFEQEIDRTLANELKRTRRHLVSKFGAQTVAAHFRSLSPALESLQESELQGAFGELREMQKEEATHAAFWALDAFNLFHSPTTKAILRKRGQTPAEFMRGELNRTPVILEVQELINVAKSTNLLEFFAKSLVATEFIAEELGDALGRAEPYTKLFSSGRALWMEVHTFPHPDGPSHWEIVLDLARAYSPKGEPEQVTRSNIQRLAQEGIVLFGQAADAVEKHYCPSLTHPPALAQ